MDFTLREEPLALFNEWLNEAKESEPNDPTAVALATVDGEGMPNVRMVLLKGHDERGFVFYTNFESAKGQEALGAMKAAMGFHWKSLRRQIRIRGPLETVSEEEADAYFNSRHPQSRLGAWASDQSRPLESREALVGRLHQMEEKYGTETIPRPPHWSGFRIIPQSIEFWKDGEFRLHDRIVFTKDEAEQSGWSKQRLNP
ncbi:MAG: pyridoxamine 5'-phosphate oxidase [Rhizobiaceae bacterium]